MTAIATWNDLMPDSITREAFTGYSSDGFKTPQYAAGVAFPNCRVEMGVSMMRDVEVRELKAIGRVWVSTTTVFDEKDRITLPADIEPNQPKIVQVRAERDESGIHHVILLLGMSSTSSSQGG